MPNESMASSGLKEKGKELTIEDCNQIIAKNLKEQGVKVSQSEIEEFAKANAELVKDLGRQSPNELSALARLVLERKDRVPNN